MKVLNPSFSVMDGYQDEVKPDPKVSNNEQNVLPSPDGKRGQDQGLFSGGTCWNGVPAPPTETVLNDHMAEQVSRRYSSTMAAA